MSPRVSAERRDKYFKDRRDQIIDAAIEVFGSKGLDTATVDQIAEAAGISKGTIYLYFKSKDEIFDVILTERSAIPQFIDWMNAAKISTESVDYSLQSFFEQIGNKFLNSMDSYFPVLRIVLADAYRYPLQAEHVYNNLILKANKMLAEFLSVQSKAGRIRKLESPLITARCFIGMLIIYVLSQEMLGGNKFLPIERNEWVRETVRIFLKGVQTNK
jgi:AcrR family transcriptional regulator